MPDTAELTALLEDAEARAASAEAEVGALNEQIRAALAVLSGEES